MKANRLFDVIVAVALVLVIGLTVREATATAAVVTRKGSSEITCADLPSHYSIHNEYVEGTGWVTYTEDGPAGVDGGKIELLSSYRTCSK